MLEMKNKTLLITGGTGSFGKKFTEIALKYNPKTIRIFSRDELKQSMMNKQFENKKLRFFIGDVRDRDRLYRAMNGVDIVVHAAALKQVPACEYNPIEAVRTNIDGAVNVIEAAINNEVKKVVAISTDKAVHPVNLYGATKMVSERLFVQSNSYTGTHKTILSCIRYGNVVGSRGSVIPLFLEQRESRTITITDERMTRFWLTLEQGVNFVLNCIERMKGGEVFIPKIPSMKIIDLANVIAPKAKVKIIGIRPGEKLHEVLLTEDEARHSKEFKEYFVIEPEYPFWDEKNLKGGKKIQDNFRYTSKDNEEWLSEKELKDMVDNL